MIVEPVMKHFPGRRTLFRDVIMSLSVITLISVTLLGSLLYVLATVREEARVAENARRLTGEMAQAIALPLMNFDHDIVVRIADAYVSSDTVDGLVIRVENKPFYERKPSGEGSVMSLKRDIRVDGLTVGDIQVMFSTASVQGIQTALFWTMAAILGSAVLVGIPTMYFLLRRLVSNPLSYLKDGLERIADGQTDEPLKPLPQQDMNDILQAANRMAEKIRQRTEQLRDSETRFRDIFENAGHGIFQVTPDGTLIRANRSMAAILGFDSQEDLKENFRYIFDQGFITAKTPSAFENGRSDSETLDVFETRIDRKDKRPVWLRIKARQVYDETGKVYCIEGFLDDVTHQKHMQEQVLQSKENLESKVEARTLGLKEKTEKMERMNRLFVDRELAMKALKEENKLLRQRIIRVMGEGQ